MNYDNSQASQYAATAMIHDSFCISLYLSPFLSEKFSPSLALHVSLSLSPLPLFHPQQFARTSVPHSLKCSRSFGCPAGSKAFVILSRPAPSWGCVRDESLARVHPTAPACVISCLNSKYFTWETRMVVALVLLDPLDENHAAILLFLPWERFYQLQEKRAI